MINNNPLQETIEKSYKRIEDFLKEGEKAAEGSAFHVMLVLLADCILRANLRIQEVPIVNGGMDAYKAILKILEGFQDMITERKKTLSNVAEEVMH